MRILYIEDDSINAMILSKFLENHFTVDIAESSEKSLSLLTSNSYDLILLDLNLGHDEENGLSLFHKIQKLDGCEKIPVLAITASSDPNERNFYLSVGFQGFIIKPVDRTSLISYLNEFESGVKVE